MIQKANALINKAIVKANLDLTNPDVDVNYTPEFLIELLTEIKQVMNTPVETSLDASDVRNFHQMD
jgi:hypothetical protein